MGYFSSDGVGVERGLIIYAYTKRKTRLKLTSPIKVYTRTLFKAYLIDKV